MIALHCFAFHWQVLSTTIMEDLAKANMMVKETSQKLRKERVRLIKLKVRTADVNNEKSTHLNGLLTLPPPPKLG